MQLLERILALLFTYIVLGHCQVLVYPRDTYVLAVGRTANFNCFSPFSRVKNFSWLANDSVLTSNSTVQQHVALQAGVLILTNLTLDYNMTTFACLVYYFDRQPLQSEGSTLLLVQGPLSSVESLALTHFDGIIYLNWTAPFTLNLTSHVLNITYCVHVMKSNSTVYQECNMVETEFRFPVPSDSTCFNYTFGVIPENSDVGDGAASTIPYLPPPSDDVTDILHSSDFSYSLIMSSPVCEGKLIFEDLDDGEIITLEDDQLTIAGNNITFTNVLRFNQRYNVTVITSTFIAMATSFITISTHDVTGVVVVERNGVEVTALYSEHSSASGALFSFVFITESGDVDFTRSALLPLDRNTPPSHTLPFNLHPGHYRIYVYDIEQDGTLYNGVGYPAVTEELSTNGTENGTENGHGQPCTRTENCHISTSRGIIRATCSMAGGFQVIALQSNANRVHLIYTNKSMDLQTPVTVQVERSGVYQVTMFATREGSTLACSEQAIVDVQIETTELQPATPLPTAPLTGLPETEDNLAATVIGAVGVFLAVAVVVVVTVFVIFKRCPLIAKRKGSGAQSHGRSCTATYHNSRGVEGNEVTSATVSTTYREQAPLLLAVPNHDGEDEQENAADLEPPAYLSASANNRAFNATDLEVHSANHPPDPPLDPGDHPISEKQAKPSVQESANADNSEEETFVATGVVGRGGSKGNHKIVGHNAKKKQSQPTLGSEQLSVDHQESDSNHGMPLPARTRDHDGQTHEAKSGSALPAFHEEVSHVSRGDIVLDPDHSPNTRTLQRQTQDLDVSPVEEDQLAGVEVESISTTEPDTTTTPQTQALEASPASDQASDHTIDTSTLQTQALEPLTTCLTPPPTPDSSS